MAHDHAEHDERENETAAQHAAEIAAHPPLEHDDHSKEGEPAAEQADERRLRRGGGGAADTDR